MNTTNSDIEQGMLQAGAERYARHQEKAQAQGELTSAQTKLFTNAVETVAASLQTAYDAEKPAGRKAPWYDCVRDLGALQCAVVALRFAFTSISDEKTSQTVVYRAIGRQLELERIAHAVKASQVPAEAKLTASERKAALKKGQEIYERLAGKAIGRNPRSMLDRETAFIDDAEKFGFWSPLSADEQLKMGNSLFNFVLQFTDLFEECNEMAESVDKKTGEIRETCVFLGFALTASAAEALGKLQDAESWMHPVYKPMLTPPRDWTSAFTGCYEDEKLAATVPLLKSFNKKQMKQVNEAVKAGATFAQAVNFIQSVGFSANLTVVHYLGWAEKSRKLKKFQADAAEKAGKPVKPFKGFPGPKLPIAEGEKKRIVKKLRKHNRAQVALAKELKTTIAVAVEYLTYGEFFMPTVLDFRDRVYAKPHLNHQREDGVKAIFNFAEGRPLTQSGKDWLAIHLCNSAAFKWKGNLKWDKAPLKDRILWTYMNSDRICKMMEDPTADLWWAEADSPFCFLAACDAWAAVCKDPEALVSIPVGIDGSCSGLQHFSAMLRDRVGGSHVNLTPQEFPADVYQVVADLVAPKVEADAAAGNPHAIRWLKVTSMNRKVAKRCVMTYVYGSKLFGFAQHLADEFEKELVELVEQEMTQNAEEAEWEFDFRIEREVKAIAFYLAKFIWDAVQETVKAAADAMGWLQDTAMLLAKHGIPLEWVTPTGFPVINAYYKPQIERVQLTLWDRAMNLPRRVVPSVQTGYTKELLPAKCTSSIAPNFVHALDGAALHMACLKAKEEGIESVMLIHDSFSCHPNDMQRFSQIVRETFVEMYEKNDPLQDLYDFALRELSAVEGIGEDELAKLTPPPSKGDLDLKEVLKSDYAFA